MNEYEEKLQAFMRENGIEGVSLSFQESCHTAADAAAAAGVTPQDIVKSICMIDADHALIVAIVRGDHRASTSRVAKALGIARPRTADADEIIGKTGYPCGGTPAFGYAARFLLDPLVMERKEVYAGAGTDRCLVRLSPQELQKANQAKVVRVRK
jgi:prolyl-tRNA editing enzyme YbaK/EbsC (Cys-tRNA(Pro) deacylase)